jgi:hypothetical protein
MTWFFFCGEKMRLLLFEVSFSVEDIWPWNGGLEHCSFVG